MTQIPNKIFKSVTFVVFVVDLLIVVVVAVGCCWKTVSAVAETAAPPPVAVGVAGQAVHPVGGRQLPHPTYSQLPRGRGPGGQTKAENASSVSKITEKAPTNLLVESVFWCFHI